ncbi:uncharacterized protein [Triticum aestivum]|uniref:uncharacterized protein n=1 Tax=Triticum aestivum TaxID=4565 RepID=UPI00084257D5|nr:uncharacterized protein LOC123133197 [Triticum aestivum]
MRRNVDTLRFASLLRAAVRLSPQEVVFTHDSFKCINVDLPWFHCATSIEMKLYAFRFTQLPAKKFSALERLCLTGCTILNLVTMVTFCPRLRVLKVKADRFARDVTINSESLQELFLSVYGDTKCQSIQIMTPLLKQVKLDVLSCSDLSVSISAPNVEKLSWLLTYNALMFGFWSLHSLSLETIESYKYNDGMSSKEDEDACLHPPRCHVLSLRISTNNRFGAVLNFEREMERLPTTNFTVLELHLNVTGHVLGPLVLRLLMMHHIRTATQRLKVFLWDWSKSKCLEKCPCDEPKNWRSQSISLTHLKDVEINNFKGGDGEIDFVKMTLRWAPKLNTMTINLAHDADIGRCATNIYSISLAYPFVNCSVYQCSGGLVQQTCL